MKVLIVGTGLSGCTLARLLKDKGHEVSMIEKEDHIGGLCITRLNEDGLKYEPYGARTFHTGSEAVWKFVQRFDQFNGYSHKKGMIINSRLYPFPLALESLNGFENRELILEELNNRPSEIDQTNFETACLSIFGPTLYGYFIKNYSEKMWGMEPRELTAEWAPKRLELRLDNDGCLFRNQWQGLPVHGYTYFLEQMVKDVPVLVKETRYDSREFDVVATTAPLDELYDFRHGKLRYRSIRFTYAKNESWENVEYGTVNLPQHERYIRKCNFNILHKQVSRPNFIQYQEATEADGSESPAMYPVNTSRFNGMFDLYLKDVCGSANLCPLGRLGLYKYLDMDKAVECSARFLPIIEQYPSLSPLERYHRITAIRQSL